jgi:hypothetical protein
MSAELFMSEASPEATSAADESPGAGDTVNTNDGDGAGGITLSVTDPVEPDAPTKM